MSTPQLVTYDAGRHNAELEASSSRILQNGSWKPQRVVVLLPAAMLMPSKVSLSHWNLVFPPNNGVYRMLAVGCEVGQAYTWGVETVLNNSDLSRWEYILTIEHDNVPPPDGVVKLIRRMEENPHFSAIGGLYWTKGEDGVPQIWGDPKDPQINFRPQVPRAGELVECCGVGMGFTLWRLKMFSDPRLRRPWFETKAEATGSFTQDLHFWMDARQFGYRCAVDCNVLVGHYDVKTDMMW